MTSQNSNSTPTRASFASALAQKPASPVAEATNLKPKSLVKSASPLVTVAIVNAEQSSTVVKLPSQVSVSNDTSKVDPVKVVPTIKFGSFAAAAAAAAESLAHPSSAGPTLPPRTQSAPPSVVKVIQSEPIPAVPVSLEPAVILPVIQEDPAHHQQAPQNVSFNYEQPQPQQQAQVPFYHNQPPQQQYQPRPRYYNPQNQNQKHHQQQRYYNPQQYSPQQYQNPNPNFRPHHNPNYRPRPQYQGEGYYHHPGMVAQGGYYPPPQAGYYRQGQEESNGPTSVAFQRPAPAFNNYNIRPIVAPVVPANLPGFSAVSATTAIEGFTIPSAPVASAPVAVPAFVKPTPSKIKIVDPATGKEVNFGPKTETVKVVEAVAIKPVEIVDAKLLTEIVNPVEAVSVVAVEVFNPTAPNKKIPENDLAVEELTTAFSQSTKLEETCESPLPVSESIIPADNFKHDKSILANLNVDDDDVSDEDDYSDYDTTDEEDEEEVFIPSTVQFNQSISYPEGFIPFKAPSDEASGVWLYSREFMLQFRENCTTTPGDLQERLSAAVEKAKAFASSERINGTDLPNRRDGQRKDRSKHRNNDGPLGPQSHLLDMNAVLKNRAENAWAPRSAEELSQADRILREVKGLLNKLTLDKFQVISEKILSLGIMSPDVLSGVIDCVFDKSVSEPRFAPMYAELCYTIVVEELNGLKKNLPANTAPDSQFRRLLVERCQAEYKHKRAWSKKRLEKLLGIPDAALSEAQTAAVSAESEVPSKASNVGELTEEDYLLIKLKRRVLGNMRFIGEIFKVGLIGEKIMHSIITELLSNVENPEEEEIECLCRLLMTVGSILDKPAAANFWNQYIGRMNWLISQPEKLSARIRFMVMDVLELREKKWITGKAEEGPKTIAQIQKDQQYKERDSRDRERDYRDNRDRNERYDDRKQVSSGPAKKFTSGKQIPPQQQQQPQSKAEEWNRSGSAKAPSNMNRGPSVTRPPPSYPQSHSHSSGNAIGISSSASSGRYEVLTLVESTVTVCDAAAAYEETSVSAGDDEERVKKIVSILDELVQMSNYEDVYVELKACGTKSAALSGLLNRAINGGKKAALQAVIRVFSEGPELARSDQLDACKQSFSMIDDLAVDVPSVYETAGQLYAALSLSLPEIFETLSECSDESAKVRVILQTLANSADKPELRDALRRDAKEFVEKNKKPAIENLMKKLNIEI